MLIAGENFVGKACFLTDCAEHDAAYPTPSSERSPTTNIGRWSSAGQFIGRTPDMVIEKRYLQFENIDMGQPVISSQCSLCGREFKAEPKPAERVDDVLLRVRADFDAHKCRE